MQWCPSQVPSQAALGAAALKEPSGCRCLILRPAKQRQLQNSRTSQTVLVVFSLLGQLKIQPMRLTQETNKLNLFIFWIVKSVCLLIQINLFLRPEIWPVMSTVPKAVLVMNLPCLESRFPCSAFFLLVSFSVLCPVLSSFSYTRSISATHIAHCSCNAGESWCGNCLNSIAEQMPPGTLLLCFPGMQKKNIHAEYAVKI